MLEICRYKNSWKIQHKRKVGPPAKHQLLLKVKMYSFQGLNQVTSGAQDDRDDKIESAIY